MAFESRSNYREPKKIFQLKEQNVLATIGLKVAVFWMQVRRPTMNELCLLLLHVLERGRLDSVTSVMVVWWQGLAKRAAVLPLNHCGED